MRSTWGIACLLCTAARAGSAQSGDLHGLVSDSVTAAPVAGARVRALAPDGQARAWDFTDADGRYRLGGLAPGAYALEVRRVGFRPLLAPQVTAPGRFDLRLAPVAVPLAPVVVTVNRTAENPLASPAAISAVERRDVEERLAASPVDHLADQASMDVASKGVAQRTFAVRGYLGANSDALLVLTDYRVSAVPSLGFNVAYLLQTPDEDIERIELQRGPGAALYGPGSDRGVLHFVTRSAFERGGSVSVAGGTRDLMDVRARYGTPLGARVAAKLSLGYLRATDWPLVDAAEVEPRDPVFERVGGEARLEGRPAAATEVSVGGGLARAERAVDIIPTGSYQLRDWDLGFTQVRLRHHDLTANVYYNWNDAGRTFSLRSGEPLVDKSRQLAGQLLYRSTVGRAQLVYGVDTRWTDPRTGGTIDGAFESRDLVREVGAFGTATLPLRPSLDLVAALRVDRHNHLEGTAVSPRIGAVYRPRPEDAIRLTYNRAFATPSTVTLFADLPLGALPGGLPYDLRAAGIPGGGYSFRRDCGGLCMRSPFNPSPETWMPTDGTLLWPAVVTLLQHQGVDLSGIPAPTAAQVASVLGLLDPERGTFTPVGPAAVTDIGPNRREITDALELGYRGLVGGRLLVEVAVWGNRVSDVLGTLSPATPNVFLDGTDLARYLGGYVPADQAAQLAATIAQLPLGTVSPREATQPTDVLLVSRQGGAYTFWGADLSADAQLGAHWSVGGSFSWVSRDSVTHVGALTDFALGIPRRQAAARIVWRAAPIGWETALRVRTVSSFHVVSGVYRGLVDAYTTVDLSAGLDLPFARAIRLSVTAQNLLDDRHREYVGAPTIGRMVMTRLQAGF